MIYSSFFNDPILIFESIITGLIFGFLLQKGGVSQFNVIAGQFLLKNFTVLKVMLIAIIVGGMALYAMLDLGVITVLPLHPSALGKSAVGGAIFGIGMALLGYCPGTALAAIGQGSRDALWGVLGMLCGATLYEAIYPWVKSWFAASQATGATLATLLGISHWIVFGGLGLGAYVLFLFLKRNNIS